MTKLNSQEPTALQELFSGVLQAKTHAIGLPRCGSRKDHLQTLRADASDLAAELTHREARTTATQGKTRPALKTVATRGVPAAVRKLEAIANEQGWEEF